MDNTVNNTKKRKFNFGLGEIGNESRTRTAGIQMIVGFMTMNMLVLVLIIALMSIRTERVMKDRTSEMVAGLNEQICASIDAFSTKIKSSVGMLFLEESYYTYDPTLTLGSVDNVTEAKMSAALSTYSSVENYMDFCIVYPYGHTVGVLSDTTWSAYGNSLYDDMASALGNKTERWMMGPKEGYDALYYLHRMNENAIVVASVSNEVLNNLVADSLNAGGISVYLTNENLVVQHTNGSLDACGSYLNTGIYKLVKKDGGVASSRLYIVCTQAISNGWFIVSAIPYSYVIESLSSAKSFMMIVGVVIFVLMMLFTVLMSRKIIGTVNQTVDKLDVKSQTDLLTGLLNKKSFEEIVDMTLDGNFDRNTYVLIFMDVDNFKGVNDRCGHDIGDEVLRSFSQTIDSVFRDDDIKGRLGGDEFCVLMKMPHGTTEEDTINTINEVCGRFRDALHKKATTGRQSMPAVTSSMGAAMSLATGDDFETLYRRADTALYHSKHKGKDTWSIYGEE